MTEKNEKLEITVATTTRATKSKAVPLEEIIPNQNFKITFGDRWYYFTKGEAVKVPAELKVFLKQQGALEVI